jgi:hypothetical protein
VWPHTPQRKTTVQATPYDRSFRPLFKQQENKQGLTGNKVEYHPLPYKHITHISIDTAGHFDLDAELKIWIYGSPMPIQKRFSKHQNIYHVQSILFGYVLGPLFYNNLGGV